MNKVIYILFTSLSERPAGGCLSVAITEGNGMNVNIAGDRLLVFTQFTLYCTYYALELSQIQHYNSYNHPWSHHVQSLIPAFTSRK